MKAYNKTHLYFEQVSDDQNGKIVDSFWIVKDHVTPAYANLKAIFEDWFISWPMITIQYEFTIQIRMPIFDKNKECWNETNFHKFIKTPKAVHLGFDWIIRLFFCWKSGDLATDGFLVLIVSVINFPQLHHCNTINIFCIRACVTFFLFTSPVSYRRRCLIFSVLVAIIEKLFLVPIRFAYISYDVEAKSIYKNKKLFFIADLELQQNSEFSNKLTMKSITLNSSRVIMTSLNTSIPKMNINELKIH